MNQQETIDALAEQNRMLREALIYSKRLQDFAKTVTTGAQDRELAKMEKVLYPLTVEALALPDLSTSILNQRDARTLREAATRFTEPGVWHKLRIMAAEKEKQ